VDVERTPFVEQGFEPLQFLDSFNVVMRDLLDHVVWQRDHPHLLPLSLHLSLHRLPPEEPPSSCRLLGSKEASGGICGRGLRAKQAAWFRSCCSSPEQTSGRGRGCLSRCPEQGRRGLSCRCGRASEETGRGGCLGASRGCCSSEQPSRGREFVRVSESEGVRLSVALIRVALLHGCLQTEWRGCCGKHVRDY